MSVSGQKRRLDHAPTTSSLHRKADIFSVHRHVSKVPMSDLASRCRLRPSEPDADAALAGRAISSLIRGALNAGIVADIVLRPTVGVDIDDAAIGFMC